VTVDVDGSRLVAFFRCHDRLFGIESEWIERLVLPGETSITGTGVIQVSGSLFAAWDLCDTLGLAPLGDEAVWVLLSIPDGDRALPIALRTGPCLGIRSGATWTALPSSLFTGRRGAFPSALFGPAVDELGGDEAVVALLIDPKDLFTPTEIAASRERLGGVAHE
jgi:hypothetical protein